MTTDIIQFASISGELSPNLYGRTDFEKYDSAWANARNWVVDYRGGLFTRAGFEFGDVVEWSKGEGVKFVEFQFSPDTENTYVCVFSGAKVRFIQNNAYVLEAAVAVVSVANGAADKIVITATGHGYTDGDWVKLSGFTDSTLTFLNGMTVEVANSTTNTFDIQSVISGSLITKASINTDTASVFRIYTVTTPYTEDQLAKVQAVQIRDYVRLTHPDVSIYNIIRNSAVSWSVALEDLDKAIDKPTATSVTVTGGANYFYIYHITAVNADGIESISEVIVVANAANLAKENNESVLLEWSLQADAKYYKVYKSRQTDGDGTTDMDVGYIGDSTGIRFRDSGITPDFSLRPPTAYNPFANGRIDYVRVDTSGTLYEVDDTIVWPAGGSGAVGFIVGDKSTTPILGIKVSDGGKGYTGTAITISGSLFGSGFTGTAILSPASGNNPHCCCVSDQRMIYGATDNFPLRIFGSRPGQLSDFSFSGLNTDDDSYEFDLDAEKVAPIRHLVPVRGGIMVFNQIGVWLLYGLGNQVLTANNAKADLQTSVGAALVRPIYTDSYVIYASAAGNEIRQLVYNDTDNVFATQNVSLLSNHLFSAENAFTSMTYAPVPFKVVYATQENGRLLSLTVDNENSVFGCTPNFTQGYFRHCMAVNENNESRLYVAVEREIDGNTVMFFERQKQRMFPRLEESFCVDAGLELTKTYPTGTLVPSSKTGAVTFTVTGGTPFASGDVGKILRCGDGMATISTFTSSTEVSGTWTRDLTEEFPETSDPAHFETNDWTLDSPTTTVSGLWHLPNESVAILADGDVVTGKSVSSEGVVTLDTAASRVAIGKGYDCVARSLPPTASNVTIENRRKTTVGFAMRVYETYSLKVGTTLDELHAISNDQQTNFATADAFRNEVIDEPINDDYEYDSQTYVVQDEPQPAAILNMTRDVDLGDDKD